MSSKIQQSIRLRLLAAIVFFLVGTNQYLTVNKVNAADLQPRTILLGSSFASEITTHSYSFTTITVATVGSIQFEYCANSPLFIDPCVPPNGIDISGATITSQVGMTGFSVSPATTNSSFVITRAPTVITPGGVSFVFDNVLNPDNTNATVFVRITLFDGINGTGSSGDTGAVAFVIEDPFNVDAYVPPYLTFCVAATVAIDCTSATGFLANLGELSPSSANTVTSQLSAATNDGDGYNIFINGQTLTSGANIIAALTTQQASNPGQSQFGINLRANTNPVVGVNVQNGPVASGTVAANYNSPNLFRFVNGDRIAGSTSSTGFNRYTISYLVNVPSNHPPGIYATTLTYTAIATF